MRAWAAFYAGGLALLVVGCTTAPAGTGRSDYASLCAGCHGADGTGDGPAAASLATAPADLTGIAARNGGSFPLVEVMAKIDGYGAGQAHEGMPAFWPQLEGETVSIDAGDGVLTPTPARLVAVAEYLRSLQR